MNGKIGLTTGVAVGLAAIGGLLYFALAPVEETDGERAEPVASSVRSSESHKGRAKVRESKPALANKSKATKKQKARMPRMQVPDDWFDKLPAGDRAVAKRIQDAQDADDQAAVLTAVEAAVDNKNVEVRSAAVEALSLQGEAAMPLLLKFVADGDKDVADAAYRAWDDAVDSVEGDLNKLTAVKQVLEVARDTEHIKSAVGKIEMFDQARAIRELAKLARGDGKISETAKESYESVTGEPFESWAVAELKAMAIDRDNAENASDEE